MGLTPAQRALEIARPWVLLAIFVALAEQRLWLLAVPAALGTFLAAFVQMHDCVHESLGLSKRGHRVLLTLAALLLLKSGQSLRATHLRHHGRCLAPDDAEGAPARWPLLRVLWAGPFHVLSMRAAALGIAPRTRMAQLAETAATVGLLMLAALAWVLWREPAGLVYWAVAAALSATMGLWAAYLPHKLASREPAVQAARRLAQLWTPIVNSFAYHHVHHRFPRVPTALLPRFAAEMGSAAEGELEMEHQH